MISVEQCRAARAMLDWSAQKLADEAKVGVATVRRFEAGSAVATNSRAAIGHALASAGVAFIATGDESREGGEGVRLVTPTSRR